MLHDGNRPILSSVKKALGSKACLVGKHVQEGNEEPWFSHRSPSKSTQK